jgi:hypothetical protein
MLSHALYLCLCYAGGMSILGGIFDETTKKYSGQIVFTGTMIAGIGLGHFIT